MDYVVELLSRYYSNESFLAAVLVALVLGLFVRGWISAAIVAIPAVAILTLVPLGEAAFAAGALPADWQAQAQAALLALPLDLAAIKYVFYVVTLKIMGFAWKDMRRPLAPLPHH